VGLCFYTHQNKPYKWLLWGSRKTLPSTPSLCLKILACPLPLSEKSGRKATHSACRLRGAKSEKYKDIYDGNFVNSEARKRGGCRATSRANSPRMMPSGRMECEIDSLCSWNMVREAEKSYSNFITRVCVPLVARRQHSTTLAALSSYVLVGRSQPEKNAPLKSIIFASFPLPKEQRQNASR
jgi:hypothetical protein